MSFHGRSDAVKDVLRREELFPGAVWTETIEPEDLAISISVTELTSQSPGKRGVVYELLRHGDLYSSLIAIALITPTKQVLRIVPIWSETVRHEQEFVIADGSEPHPPGVPDATFAHGTRGFSLSFSEHETQVIIASLNTAVGAGALATAIASMAGVALPGAILLGVVTAILSFGASLLTQLDLRGGHQGVCALFWAYVPLFVRIRPNPVPPGY